MTAHAYATEYEPGSVLSPSQAKMFLGCSAKWAFKYYLRLPDPKTGALLQGSALHDVAEENHRNKLETRQDLPVTGAVALFRDRWGELKQETEFREDEDESELKAEGEQLVTTYLEDVAPRIEPAAVELPVQGAIGGVPVRGFIDLLDASGRVIDLKSKKQTPPRVGFDEILQVSTYRALCPEASGAGRIDVLVKNKTVKHVQFNFEVDAADLTMVERIYPQVQAGIRTQVFTPNRSSVMCSRKYCGYWRACQKEFGGTVPE